MQRRGWPLRPACSAARVAIARPLAMWCGLLHALPFVSLAMVLEFYYAWCSTSRVYMFCAFALLDEFRVSEEEMVVVLAQERRYELWCLRVGVVKSLWRAAAACSMRRGPPHRWSQIATRLAASGFFASRELVYGCCDASPAAAVASVLPTLSSCTRRSWSELSSCV